MAFELPKLPYDYKDLEPIIDEQTMRLHHDKHHGAYVEKLNAAIKGHAELERLSVADLLRQIERVPENIRTTVRNNGGGHANHEMFWKIMKPRGSEASGRVLDAIKQSFGDLNQFQEKFNTAGANHFGSGWVWLVRSNAGKIEIITSANQDSPFMQGHYPIMGNDLWEHAYYLKYNNRRPEYLKAWWQTLNWEEINRRFEESERAVRKAA
jgi:superoxide dismutase, Fe-Mn family